MPLPKTLGGARHHVGPAAKGAAGLMLAGNFVPL